MGASYQRGRMPMGQVVHRGNCTLASSIYKGASGPHEVSHRGGGGLSMGPFAHGASCP